jgi:putative transposase
VSRVLTHIKPLVSSCFHRFQGCLLRWTQPTHNPLLLGTVMDLARGKSELIAENALLRQQLVILRRQIKRPRYTKTDRLLLVLLARAVRPWRQALLIVQPETLLRWHRQGFRLFWKHQSKATSHKPKVTGEIIALIKEMAKNNRLWGAERIRGELLKLDIHVCKRTIQKYMRGVRTPRPKVQSWRTFLRHHAREIWACDFLQVTDLFFHSLFAFFIIELQSRKVIHVGVTRSPTDAWTAQQLREATPYGQTPTYLIRDHDTHGLRNELTSSEHVSKNGLFEGKETPLSQQGDLHDKYHRFLGQYPNLCRICSLPASLVRRSRGAGGISQEARSVGLAL